MLTLPFTVDQVVFFFLVFLRVVTIIALMPIFGTSFVPSQLKVGMSLLFTTLLFLTNSNLVYSPEVKLTLPLLGLFIIKEILTGLLIGYVTSLLFAALQFAGRLIDNEMGFGFVELIDPINNETVSVLGQLFVATFSVIFLLLNGHYFMLMAIASSFEKIPLMSIGLPSGSIAFHLTYLTSNIFVLALKFSAPVYVTLI
ncbi:MAG: flagellar biosynthetic protein FliR, partial [Chitinispirillaceae bacterium]|nr:flagellar biosynthetic protein FliR [Chitinispirillaceae bacterium]